MTYSSDMKDYQADKEIKETAYFRNKAKWDSVNHVHDHPVKAEKSDEPKREYKPSQDFLDMIKEAEGD